jgi:sucrose-phosphate synthase
VAVSGLYIQLFSIHGLIRGESPELGKDADTGGQVKYVLELARTFDEHPEVERVDLVTRLIDDKAVSRDYARVSEELSAKARLVRIQCGGRKYMRKELLWPHLDEFVDKTLKLIKSEGRIPDLFHGHYADGGYVASELASIFSRPFVFTGHSLGQHKKIKLLADGMSEPEVNRRYHIDRRIGVEERLIKYADRVITSTSHEIKKQYGLYENGAHGRYRVIPPGIDRETFYPYYAAHLDDPAAEDETFRQARMTLLHELHRFWVDPHKPFILAVCRPDHRKNIAGLVTAYGEDRELQAIANLAIFAGIRKNITVMEENERYVLTEMLLLMDRYDLYGKLAIPKKHDFSSEVPELYRLCADSHGVFVNPALVEPFGLTLVEAASCGLPIVATSDGGPADIIANCENGILIDPTDTRAIAAAAKKILVDGELWAGFSRNGINGVRKHYRWKSHGLETIKIFGEVLKEVPEEDGSLDGNGKAIGQRLTKVAKLLISDIDTTLIGEEAALGELIGLLHAHRQAIGWGVATGRGREATLRILRQNNIPRPDILICEVGTEIYYGPKLTPDNSWRQHISHQWKPELIQEELAALDFLVLQEEENRRQFKISYYMEDNAELLAKVHEKLQRRKIRYHLVFSRGQFLDILPYRASKGKAVRYLSYKWEIPLADILACGNSGSDMDMLRGDTAGVVVGNYSKEIEPLRGLRRTYFSKQAYAAGILDGINHYNFV